jgi:hypothetical protein
VTRRLVVLVSGSRDWDDAVLLFEELSRITDEYRSQVLHESYAPILVLEGDSGRADLWADAWAQLGLHEVERFPAQWRENGVYNPQAGFERNSAMLARIPDVVIAFQKNKSRGTQDTIDKARAAGIPVEVISAP